MEFLFFSGIVFEKSSRNAKQPIVLRNFVDVFLHEFIGIPYKNAQNHQKTMNFDFFGLFYGLCRDKNVMRVIGMMRLERGYHLKSVACKKLITWPSRPECLEHDLIQSSTGDV